MFFGPIGKTTWSPWPLIGWDLFNSSLKPLNGIQWNLTGSKISTSSTKFVFFGPIGKTTWSPWPLIGWDLFNSSLKPLNGIQWNLTGSKISTSSTKFVFFGLIGKNKMAALASDWRRHFRLLPWNRWMEFNETWQEQGSKLTFSTYWPTGPVQSKFYWPDQTFTGPLIKCKNEVSFNIRFHAP